MDYYSYLVATLGKVVSENDCDFILYPFGEHGALIKGILNVIYGIDEKAVIDNILCDTYEKVERLEYLKSPETESCKILITSDRSNIYEELREKLYEVVSEARCIDLFPTPYLAIKPNTLPQHQNLLKEEVILKMSKEGVAKEKPIYHPKNTRSVFYLPLLLTDFIQQSVFLSDDYFERKNLERVFAVYENGVVKKRVAGG